MRDLVKIGLSCILSMGLMGVSSVRGSAESNQITNMTLSAKSSLGHGAELAIDGDKSTYYMTPASTSMDNHYRSIDFTLDGIYDVSKIKIYNNVGSYHHYQIYASETGENFKKVAFKSDNNLATPMGDEYVLSGVKASKIRINLSYNSNQLEGNLAEVEIYGDKIGQATTYESQINVSNFKDTSWGVEHAKVQQNEEYARQKTVSEMSALVGRVIGEKWRDSFVFEQREANEGKDIFEIENGINGKIIIRGNNGIAMASGFNYYLRYYCKVDYNPFFASQLNMPEHLPALEAKIVKETEYDYRYALNFCTYSYTMAFWNWDEYEAFLDWAAMSGINTMLDIVGQEEVVRRMLSAYGYSDSEVKEYISGPGYFAWYYMQNMTGYGGPLPDNWFGNRVELARRMHDRMQTYGIKPVLSGFSGMVPRTFKAKHHDVKVISQGSWCGFERPDMLRTYVDSGKDYFDEMADVFYQAQHDLFGDITNIYAVDPFHEGGKIADMNVTKVYEIVQQKMIDHDADAIWLIQQWQSSMNDAKLSGLKVKNQALVLDLFSEINPESDVMEKNEIPWIWNMLHNFGGRMGLDANPEKISQNIPTTFQNNRYMKGIGMTPEALENSPMAYELLWDMTWTKDPIDYREWSQKYAERIYGGTNEDIQKVWQILLETGYNRKQSYYQGAAESVINARPTMHFTSASTWGHSTINYDKKALEEAAALMAKNYDTFKHSRAFIYDFSDITRQVLANSAQEYHQAMVAAYQNGQVAEFETLADKFLDMILLQDNILSTNSAFLVGQWIAQSRSMLENSDDWTKDLFEFNARNLITSWGSQRNANDGGLKDYSNRQWAGITKDYYYPRWEKWINHLKTAMKNGTSTPSEDWFLMEWDWANRKSDEDFSYPTEPSHFPLNELAHKVLKDYSLSTLDTLVGNMTEKENIALGKPVIASVVTEDQYPTINVTDGNKNTAWKSSVKATEYALTVDLQEFSSIEGIEISLAQLAGGFPLSYKVEVLEASGWKSVAEDSRYQMTSQTLIDYKGVGSQVRFTFKTNDATLTPEVMELLVYGKANTQTAYDNLATQAIVTSSHADQYSPNRLIDGDLESLWVNNGESYPITLTFDLPKEEQIDVIELYFEKAGLRFQYDVVIEDATGNRNTVYDMTSHTTDLAKMYKIPVKAQAKKVYVTITGKATGGSFPQAWPALAEVKILKEKTLEFATQNIALGKLAYVMNTSVRETSKLTDGSITDLENVGSDIFPTTFSVDLGSNQDLNDIKIFFEKAGIRFKFKVEVEDENGQKVIVFNKLDNTENLEASYSIPVNVVGRKIHVVIEGRATGGEYYLASPAMTEIEVYAKRKNVARQATITSNIVLTDDHKKALVDGDYHTTVELNQVGEKQIIFDFEKPKDLYAYELFKVNAGALHYRLDYLPYQSNQAEWINLVDKSNNLKDSSVYMQNFPTVLASKIRLTLLNEHVNIAQINLYQSDVSGKLASYINMLKDDVSKLPIGEYAGNYSIISSELLNNAIDKAKNELSSEINSADVDENIRILQEAYATFLKSYVEINRTPLLVELTEAKSLLHLKQNVYLQNAYDEAKLVYNTIKVTQSQLDEAKNKLKLVKEDVILTLNSLEKYQVQLAIAKELLANTSVGEYTGNTTQLAQDALRESVEQAEKAIETLNDVRLMDYSREQLEVAIQQFKDRLIRVDKKELQDLMAKASLFLEKDYTKTSWTAIEDALNKANQCNIQNSSLSDVEKAKELLSSAMTKAVLLDRTFLHDAIKRVESLSEQDYTTESWQVLQSQLVKAKTLDNKVSVDQEELNDMAEQVAIKIKNLVTLKQEKQSSNVTPLDDETSSRPLLSEFEQARQGNQGTTLNSDKDVLEELKEVLNEAKVYLKQEQYTSDTYKVFENYYHEALALLNQNKKPADHEIKKAMQNVKSSIKELQPVNQEFKEKAVEEKTENLSSLGILGSVMLLIIIVGLIYLKKR